MRRPDHHCFTIGGDMAASSPDSVRHSLALRASVLGLALGVVVFAAGAAVLYEAQGLLAALPQGMNPTNFRAWPFARSAAVLRCFRMRWHGWTVRFVKRGTEVTTPSSSAR